MAMSLRRSTRRGQREGELVVFLGPSLPLDEAQRLVRATFLPPARQGDVFAALRRQPRAIALIDGVFEASPSVWHHELIAAQAAGVRVLGASSMGALRAAELPGVVRPVGTVAQRYVSGDWNDDAFVALLHADASRGYRALTVPHVNVWATLQLAVRRRVLTRAQAARWERRSEETFYQSRTWASVLQGAPAALTTFVARSAVDLKAADARACLKALARVGRSGPVRETSFSSFVRRVRLPSLPPDPRLEADGVKTLLLAQFARLAGLTADPRRVAFHADRLPHDGWADDERWSAATTLALEELVLSAPEFFVSDGPSRAEGLRLEWQRRRGR
jgi:hypothetical protein